MTDKYDAVAEMLWSRGYLVSADDRERVAHCLREEFSENAERMMNDGRTLDQFIKDQYSDPAESAKTVLMEMLKDAYYAGWDKGHATTGYESDWLDEDWIAYCDAREIEIPPAE